MTLSLNLFCFTLKRLRFGLLCLALGVSVSAKSQTRPEMPPEGIAWYQAAFAFAAKQNYDSAIVYAQKAMKVYEQHAAWEEAARSRVLVAEMAFRADDLMRYADFIKTSEQFATQFLGNTNSLTLQLGYYQILILKMQNRIGEALEYLNEYNQFVRNLSDNEIFKTRFNSLYLNTLLEEKNIISAYKIYSNSNKIKKGEEINLSEANIFLLTKQYYLLEKFIKSDFKTREYKNISDLTYLSNINHIFYTIYSNKGLTRKYLPVLLFFKDIQIKLLGDKHFNLFTTYNQIGTAYRLLGRPDTALYYHNAALRGTAAELGVDNARVAVACQGIGLIYRHIQDHVQSIYYFDQAASVFRKTEGQYSTTFAYSIMQIAESHLLLNAPARASLSVQQAIRILCANNQEDTYINPDINALNPAVVDFLVLAEALALKSKIFEQLYLISGSQRDAEVALESAKLAVNCSEIVQQHTFEAGAHSSMLSTKRQATESALEMLWLKANKYKKSP